MYFPGVHLYLGVRTETKPWAASPCVGGEAQGSLCGELSGCLGAVSCSTLVGVLTFSPASCGPVFGESESEVAQSCPTLCDPVDSSLHQAPPSMGFSRQEYWSGLPLLSPGNLPNPGIKPAFPALEANSLTTGPLGKLKRRFWLINLVQFSCSVMSDFL